MIRVSAVENVRRFDVEDKQGVIRKLELFEKKGNVYIGPIQALFNRTYVCRDKNRIEFSSKLDKRFNELMHVSVIIKKIEKHKKYSNFTVDMIKQILYDQGFDDSVLTIKDKVYTCARENFIEYGFNSMNFCLDRRGDIWVHYKDYEETKQYREILQYIPEPKRYEFIGLYRKMIRFVRYVSIDEGGDVKGFALKSINITKLYNWLSENHLIHKVKYVADIYNEAERELSFTDITVENTFVKVIVTSDGLVLKPSPATV